MNLLKLSCLLGVSLIALSNCNQGITTKIEIYDIRFYNSENEEIEVQTKNYYAESEYFNSSTLKPSQLSKKEPLYNSPAPVFLYYCADILDGEDVKVEIDIKTNASTIDSIYLNIEEYKVEDLFDYNIKGDIHTISILFENIKEDRLFSISKIGVKNGQNYHFGYKGGQVYKRGFFFHRPVNIMNY